MSDTIDDLKAIDGHRKAMRANFGVPCPECQRLRARANATILLPQQRCKVDRYTDPRPELTDEQWSSL